MSHKKNLETIWASPVNARPSNPPGRESYTRLSVLIHRLTENSHNGLPYREHAYKAMVVGVVSIGV